MKNLFFTILLFVLISVFVSAQSVSVATVNSWSGLTYKGFFASGRYEGSGDMALRYDNFIKQLGRYRPDVLGLIEANPAPAFAKDVASDLDYQYIYNVSRGGVRIGKVGLPANLREGEAILAKEKFELEKVGSKLISGGPSGNTFSFQIGQTCQVFGGKIKVGKREIFVFVTQWKEMSMAAQENLNDLLKDYSSQKISGGEFLKKAGKVIKEQQKRMEQAEATLDYINEIAGTNDVIFMGTLNTLPGSPELDIFTDAGFIDAFAAKGSGSGITWDARRNSNITEYYPEAAEMSQRLRLDYIFIRGSHLTVSECRVFLNRARYGSYPSDHYGVFARISVR